MSQVTRRRKQRLEDQQKQVMRMYFLPEYFNIWNAHNTCESICFQSTRICNMLVRSLLCNLMCIVKIEKIITIESSLLLKMCPLWGILRNRLIVIQNGFLCFHDFSSRISKNHWLFPVKMSGPSLFWFKAQSLFLFLCSHGQASTGYATVGCWTRSACTLLLLKTWVLSKEAAYTILKSSVLPHGDLRSLSTASARPKMLFMSWVPERLKAELFSSLSNHVGGSFLENFYNWA